MKKTEVFVIVKQVGLGMVESPLEDYHTGLVFLNKVDVINYGKNKQLKKTENLDGVRCILEL
jgi:hypothetical protein